MMRLAVLVLAALIVAPAHAQSYPSKTVRWIVPLPPGGSTDLIWRLLAQKLSEMWRVPVVVENRVGAAGTIGLAAAAKSLPDGYTIALGQTSNLAVAPGLYPKLGYDPLKDLAARRSGLRREWAAFHPLEVSEPAGRRLSISGPSVRLGSERSSTAPTDFHSRKEPRHDHQYRQPSPSPPRQA